MSEQAYLDLLRKVRYQGEPTDDRTGVGTLSLFGEQLRFNLAYGFPLLTTKKVSFKAVAYELLWFLRADENLKYLHEHDIHIWDANSFDGYGVGPIYGNAWRKWYGYGEGSPPIDQLANVISEIKSNPTSRRLVVSAWKVDDLDSMCLPPCHVMFQFSVRNGRLSCSMYQRSADTFLGLPFNIASYALLTHMVADVTGLKVGDLIISLGDVHLYNNHFHQAGVQMWRKPYLPPVLRLRHRDNIDDFVYEDIELIHYLPQPAIPAPMAV